MTDFDAVIIGAGVVGLAIGRKLSIEGKSVAVIEEQDTFGTITSSRNSGVIHAGVYYDKGSLKAKFCPEGNRRIYEYCEKYNVPHLNTGKFIVATSNDEIEKLVSIYEKAIDAGVEGIKRVTKDYVNEHEPLVDCVEALYVPTTGIVDQNALMRSYIGEIEDSGSNVVFNSQFIKATRNENVFEIEIVASGEETKIKSGILINASGLYAEKNAKKLDFLENSFIPKTYLAKGNYFETGKDLKIRHLIYPIPNEASLGLHLGLDLGMQVRFGPDVEWVDDIDYKVNPNRLDAFYNDIKKYLPHFDKSLLKPGYSGIRPKIKNKGEGKSDFLIQGSETHSIKGMVNLFGIESPGLTSSLVIADYVSELIA